MITDVGELRGVRGDQCLGNNGMWHGKEMVGGVWEQGVEVGVDAMGGEGW